MTTPQIQTGTEKPRPQPSAERPVVFTEAAVERVKEFASRKPEQTEGKNLRVFVQGGGCSGFEYGFSFDERKETDEVIAQGDIEVLVDSFSLPYLEGCVVDYKDGFMGSGFVVDNPNASGTCGCGQSFQA